MPNYPDVDLYDPIPDQHCPIDEPPEANMTRISTTKVFVYGTLREGGSNHDIIPRGTKGWKAKTLDAFVMTAYSSFPAVYETEEGEAGTTITGEVYEVDSETLARLDGLEGHPSWYRRGGVDVYLEHSDNAASVATVQMYIMQGERQGPIVKSGDFTAWEATKSMRSIFDLFNS